MTTKEILKKHNLIMQKAFGTSPDVNELIPIAMDEYAKQQAIEFFKWNARTVSSYLDYLKDGGSNTFEGATIAERYELFLKSKEDVIQVR